MVTLIGGCSGIQGIWPCCVFRDLVVLFAGRHHGVTFAVEPLEYPRSVTPWKYRDFPN
jgi:hypothetical protein